MLKQRRSACVVAVLLVVCGHASAQTDQKAVAPATAPTLWVVGDSTAKNGADRGWASHFQPFFDTAKLKVENRALGGRSSRTFITEGLWDAVVSNLKRGDFVLIQFGHNDGGSLNTDRARGSIRGIGDESREVTMPDGKQEVVHTYGWYLRKYVADARAKGATPIILSPIVRNDWRDGKVLRPATYPTWAAQVAAAEKCLFVDVHSIIADRYDQMGEEAVKPFFPEEHTHPSPAGSKLNAELIVSGVKLLESTPLAPFLSETGRGVPPYRPASTR